MLPNLSALTLDDTPKASKSLERYTGDLSSIDAPSENWIAKLVVLKRDENNGRLEAEIDWNFGQIRAYLAAGATFWCVNHPSMMFRKLAKAPLRAYLLRLPLSAPPTPIKDEQIRAIADAQGGFNYTIIVPFAWKSAQNANAEYEINHEPIVTWAMKLINNNPPGTVKSNRVAIRVSKRENMDELQLDRVLMFPRGYQAATNSVLDYIAQELYLTLYAAMNDIGPKVFACRCHPMQYRRTYENENGTTTVFTGVYWRVVYALEGGDDDLSGAIRNVCNNSANYGFAGNFGGELFQLLRRTSDAQMILTDIKSGNMITFLEPEVEGSSNSKQLYTTVKMIDFGPDFATFLPLLPPYGQTEEERKAQAQAHKDCIMFVNCIMLAIYIASSLSDEKKSCFYPYMSQIFEFIEAEQTTYNTTVRPRDGDRKTLCHLVQEAMYDPAPNSTRIAEVTLFENNTSLTNIIKKMIASVKNYTLQGADPPVTEDARGETPLFRTYPYRNYQGLLRQLIQNALYDYESILYPTTQSSVLYQRKEELPPMRYPTRRPAQEGVRRNPRRQARQRTDEDGAYRQYEDDDS
jgi:hypothetical protein